MNQEEKAKLLLGVRAHEEGIANTIRKLNLKSSDKTVQAAFFYVAEYALRKGISIQQIETSLTK